MTNRIDIPKTPPLRAERRIATQAAPAVPASPGPAHASPAHALPATPGGLIRSTLIAAGAAGAILVLFWLPAEYGIDPTGLGALTGLAEMGAIKQQLASEAAADAVAAALPAQADPVSAPPDLVARLDKIDAQLAALAAVIGAPAAVSEGPAALASVPEATSTPAPVEAAQPAWRDEVSYTLAPGQGVEVKLVMQAGQVARFAWTANGGVVNYDTHADGEGQSLSYEQGRAVPEKSGDLVAAFTGNHGWFWRNRTDAPVTVTLRTAGQYSEMRAP